LNPLVTRNLMSEYARVGDDEKALQWEALIRERGDRYQRQYLVQTYARKGDMETARELAVLWASEHGFEADMGKHILEAFMTGHSEAFEKATDTKVAAGQLPLGQAIWNYVSSGADEDKVFAIIDGAIPQGRFNQISLLHPIAARYRQDPRFVEIYTQLGLVDYWTRVELPDFCSTESIPGLCD